MRTLDDPRIPARLKLAALWTSTLFCYIYCDYFELYIPGKLQEMLAARFGPLGATSQGNLLGAGLMMAVASLMISVSALAPAPLARWANILFGALFTAMMAMLAFVAGWYFYKSFAAIEALLTACVVWQAWRWPHATAQAQAGPASG